MSTATLPGVLHAADIRQYHTEGYTVARGLVGADECARLIDHYMAMHRDPPRAHYDPADVEDSGGDPLELYPRIMHPHRFDEPSRRYLLDRRILSALTVLLGEAPVAAQSMLYFKPPGSRGQALHQDNFYLKVSPGSCIAAWLALERSDSENGGLMVVPKTQELEVICPTKADPGESFSSHYVRPPEGRRPLELVLEGGDVLFFNGSVIHGSPPNRSGTRWRRSFICHYMAESDREVAWFYHPLLDAAGEVVSRGMVKGGGPCGEDIGYPEDPPRPPGRSS